MPEATGSRVFNIPAGQPFLARLAEVILSGELPGDTHDAARQIDLPNILLLLPTRRACRAMQEAFLAASGGRALLLPHIRPIGETDEVENLLGASHSGLTDDAGESELPPAIDTIERHILLTSLVLKWIEFRHHGLAAAAEDSEDRLRMAGAETPAQASALARGLARLMDMVETEGADLSKLADLAPAAFSEQWQQTLDFLQILAGAWPAILEASGKISPAERRNLVLAMEARRLTEHPPNGPIIVAGVTGSIPATAALIKVIAGLPAGAVVLSGLDQTLPDDAWGAVRPLSPSHPQFRLACLLDHLGIERWQVRDLAGRQVARLADRARFVGEALRPARTTAAWGDIPSRLDATSTRAALAGVTRLDAGTSEDEAEAIALILRQAADTPHTNAALVTPDRTLARRVTARLTSWGISVDDSAGRPLAKTPPGVLLDLVITAVATGFAPAPTMALLKHPLARLGMAVADIRRGARMMELRALRRPHLGNGLDRLRGLLTGDGNTNDADDHEAHHRAISSMPAHDIALAREVLDRLIGATAPLVRLMQETEAAPLQRLVDAHIAVSEAVAADEAGSFDALWSEVAGEAASTFLARVIAADAAALNLRPVEYPDFYRSLIATENVRPARTSHPNLAILGPFEARLLQPDVVILGGLNDGVWPEIAEPDPWLNRPMLASLGLPQPEARIGDAAHDFVQLLCAPKVYLTRALKRDGAPTVASRWLLRMDAVLTALGLQNVMTGDSLSWLAWAQNQKALIGYQPRPAPAPTPPLEARPRKLSVTRIEHWMANPYAIFARDILKLEPMPGLGDPPEASVRGRIIHQALHRFARRHPEDLPLDAATELVDLAQAALAKLAVHPRVAAFWRPRFARFASWFALTESGRRQNIVRTLSEIPGAIAIAAPGGAFRLTARADRIDRLRSGGLVITDYKTGSIPLNKRVVDGLAPQLPLEAAIAMQGGFEGIAAGEIEVLRFISATGGEPAGLEQDVDCDDVSMLAERTLAGLGRLISLFDDPLTPYASLRRTAFVNLARYDDYEHLARVKEWSLLAEDEDDE